jgi:hypothetical protein
MESGCWIGAVFITLGALQAHDSSLMFNIRSCY